MCEYLQSAGGCGHNERIAFISLQVEALIIVCHIDLEPVYSLLCMLHPVSAPFRDRDMRRRPKDIFFIPAGSTAWRERNPIHMDCGIVKCIRETGVAAASHARALTGSQALTGRVSQAYRSNARWRTRLSEPILLKWNFSMSRYRTLLLVVCRKSIYQ